MSPYKKKEGKKRPHQSTLLCVKKNKAGGRGGCQKMTSVILWHGLVSDSQIPLWSFVDLWVSLILRRILDISFQDSRSNKCSPTPPEPFVGWVFRWSNKGVASKVGDDLLSKCGYLSNIGGWGEGAVRLGASRSSWTGSPIWKQKNFMEKKEK